MKKILFVCHGNICRSPMAEFVFKDMVKDHDNIFAASAATSSEEIGNGVHPGTAAVLRRLGIDFTGKRAVKMKRSDYDEYDLIIGMDSWNIRNILRITGGDPEGKIHKLLSFAGDDGDIADPWYTHDFETTYRDIKRGCEGLLGSV